MATSSLQVAQILADLQTLQNADPTAALTLLRANSTISPLLIRRKSQRAVAPESPSFEHRFGRRISSTPRPSTLPTLSSNSPVSFASKSRQGSGISIPSIYEIDEDMKRAKTLLSLYEMRGKVQQMGDAGLARAKARVDAIVAKHAEVELADKERRARARHFHP